MGCTDSTHILPPNIPPQHLARLMQVSDVNHQLNVNKKYEYLAKLDQSSETGSGLKKTYAYHCLTTESELEAKRKQFWETRINGSAENWEILHKCTKLKTDTQITEMLTRARLSPLNDSIQMNVDHKGNKYQLPVFVINAPSSFSSEKIADRNLINNYQEQKVTAKIRSVKFPNDTVEMEVSNNSSIQELKVMLMQRKDLGDCSIRFFFNGREMHDSKTLGNYGYPGDSIIQAMIK